LIHYPVPVHLQPAYRDHLFPAVPLVETEKAARQVLSLPMFPELDAAQVAAVAQAVLTWPNRS
jgi:dTDP-4-amino-4,6-dideoxygalactose transaminase